MPPQTSLAGRGRTPKCCPVWLLLTLWLAVTPAAFAGAGQAALTADVPAGHHKVLRLRNLPKDARIAVAIQSSGRITVTFLNEADFKRFPNPVDPVFVAPVEQTISFALTMPETGDYYVVFDNTRGTDSQKVKMVIRAVSGAGPARPGPAPEPPPARPPPDRKEF